MVEQNVPNNMEAVFFSAYGKAMLSLSDSEFYKRQQKFKVLEKSISVINDYYEVTKENKETVLRNIAAAIQKMYTLKFVCNYSTGKYAVGSQYWQIGLFNLTRQAFITELDQILEKHDYSYIREIKAQLTPTKKMAVMLRPVFTARMTARRSGRFADTATSILTGAGMAEPLSVHIIR